MRKNYYRRQALEGLYSPEAPEIPTCLADYLLTRLTVSNICHRQPLDRQIDRLVFRWVITSEYLLLCGFALFFGFPGLSFPKFAFLACL